jgi:hypothetical protein
VEDHAAGLAPPAAPGTRPWRCWPAGSATAPPPWWPRWRVCRRSPHLPRPAGRGCSSGTGSTAAAGNRRGPGPRQR